MGIAWMNNRNRPSRFWSPCKILDNPVPRSILSSMMSLHLLLPENQERFVRRFQIHPVQNTRVKEVDYSESMNRKFSGKAIKGQNLQILFNLSTKGTRHTGKSFNSRVNLRFQTNLYLRLGWAGIFSDSFPSSLISSNASSRWAKQWLAPYSG